MKKTIKDLFLIGLVFVTVAMMSSCEPKEDNSDFCTDNSEIFGEFLTNDRFGNNENRLFYVFNYDCTMSLYTSRLARGLTGYELVKDELVYTGAFDYTNGILNVQDLYWDSETSLVNGRMLITEGRGLIKLKKVN